MNVPRNVEFPEFTNPAINAAMVADKLNETLNFLREKYPETPVLAQEEAMERQPGLRPGVREVVMSGPRGGKRYFLNSKMIKASEAFL